MSLELILFFVVKHIFARVLA